MGWEEWGETGWIEIKEEELEIEVNGRGDYRGKSYSEEEILKITRDRERINEITKEKNGVWVSIHSLEVYACK